MKKTNRNSRKKPQNKQVVVQQEIISHHTGPLPAPNDFAAYDHVIPGAAERILTLAETESAHRRSQERKAMSRMHREAVLGQVFALLIGMSGIAASIYLAVINEPYVATAIGGGTLVALVTAFIKGRK